MCTPLLRFELGVKLPVSISIRPVADGDRKRWESCFRRMRSFIKLRYLKVVLMGCGVGFKMKESLWCDVAESGDGQVIGFTQYQLMHRSLGGSMVCYLSDLYVEPGLRGGGVGRGLIDHVVEFAKQRGLPGVRWLTQEFNYPARRLYDTYSPKTDFILYNVPT